MTPQRAVPKTSSTPLPRLLDRHFFLIAALLLSVMAGAQFGSAVQESPTNDEPVHLTAGYVYLTTGEYSMDNTRFGRSWRNDAFQHCQLDCSGRNNPTRC